MLNKIMWSSALVSLVAIESYSFMPRKYMFAGLTTSELFGATNTAAYRVRLFIKVPLVFSLCSVLFMMIYPAPSFKPLEKVALFVGVCAVRILLSANIATPKHVMRRLVSWGEDSPPRSPQLPSAAIMQSQNIDEIDEDAMPRKTASQVD